ncbi:MAG: hypothetical protein ACLUQX_01290 [Thomasclavelia spiroformis]
MNQWMIKLKNIKAIIGTNLEKLFLNLKYPEHCKAACIYKNNEYEIEVWVMPDKVYDIIVKMSSRKFKKLAGENAFWAEWVGNGVERDEYGRVTSWSWTELP